MRTRLTRVALFVLVALAAGMAAAAVSCTGKPPEIAEKMVWDQGTWDVQNWQ